MKTWRALVTLLDRREDAMSLAICRILAASTVFLHLVSMWTSGTARALWVDETRGGILGVSCDLLEPIGGCSVGNVAFVTVLTGIAALFMAVGAFTRVAALATWFGFRFLVQLNWAFGGSSYWLLTSALFVLALSGCGRALSIDARRGGTTEAPAWPRYVLIIQLVLMYWSTGIQKVSAGWIPGGPLDAVWYVLRDPNWTRFDPRGFAPPFALTQAASLGTWLFENSSPLLLLAFWFRATRDRPGRVRAFFNRFDIRAKYLLVGASLHLGIAALMEVGPFAAATFVLYAACFAPREWRAVLARVRPRARVVEAPAVA